ncbi:MAG: PEP-CTERM sorting domain-containing protein [Phycisphaera sp.]|nr:PEP-CTERM sorting domain-containing protein [Phycisphaera sp.]
MGKLNSYSPVATAVVALVLCVGVAHADVIYTETFNNTNTDGPTGGKPLSDYGWSGYDNGGTNLSTSTNDPLRIHINDYVFIGSGGPYANNIFAMFTALAAVNPAGYDSDLTISFGHSAIDDNPTNSGSMGWRVLVEVGGSWYASDFIARSISTSNTNVVVSSANWHSWEDPTNGFADGGYGASASLPAGGITRAGVLAIDGPTQPIAGNDRLYLRDFTVSGTAIPEPASLVLIGLLGIGIASRRDRRLF